MQMIVNVGNYYSEADGEGFLIMKDGYESFDVGEAFCVAPLERFPTLFKKAYKNKETALEELKNKYSKYSPADFDYNAKFIHYIGTTFG